MSAPPATYPGYSQVVVSGLPWPSGAISVLQGSTPPVINGMYIVYEPTTPEDGFTVLIDSKGVPIIESGGSIARQSFLVDVWTGSAWLGQVKEYVNNQAPIVTYTGQLTLNFIAGVAINSVDFNQYVTDPEGDPITVTALSTLPLGLTLAAGILSGTPSVGGTTVLSLVAKDFLNESAPFPAITIGVTAIVVPVVPNVVGLSEFIARSTITAAKLVPLLDSNAYSPTVTAGLVISQAPAAGTNQVIGTIVSYVLSLGPEPVVSTVPSVVGLLEGDGIDSINLAGLTPLAGTSIHSDIVSLGVIISQIPPPGTILLPANLVTYIVSLGPSSSSPGNAIYIGQVIFESMKGSDRDMVVFDFLKNLAAGETISTAAVTASVYSGNDAAPSNIISGNAIIEGSKVKQVISSGVVGTIYELICEVTTSLGQRLKLAAYQAIQTDLIQDTFMRLVTLSLAAAGSSPWVPVNELQNMFQIGLGAYITSGASLTYNVQHTFDDFSIDARKPVTISRTTVTATVTDPDHRLSTNDNVFIEGSGVTQFDGSHDITYINANSYSFTVANSGATADVGPTFVKRFHVYPHALMTLLTARGDGNYAFNIKALRLNVSTYVSGKVDLIICQGMGR